jgi:hypothetical protein
MNTEKIKTLEQIHNAIIVVEQARESSTLTYDERHNLESTSVKLWSLEQAIIRKSGDDLITALTNDSYALSDLASKIKESAQSLEDVATIVETAAKVVRVLIIIITTAGGAGLL